jgi:hypothetical protein
MKKESKAERVIALMKICIDALRRIETAPDSPMNRYTSVEERREFRRTAKRLLKGQLSPVHENVLTGASLADILVATAQRDDAIDQARDDFRHAERELRRLTKDDDPEVKKAIEAFVAQMVQEALEGGPDSEAAHRLRCLHLIGELGMSMHNQKRRQTHHPVYLRPRLTSNPLTQARMEAAAAQFLTSLPADEPFWAFPAVPAGESGNGARRLIMRIGIDPVSWVATFERGNKAGSTVQLMPGDKHFFVSAAGAGYIIEALTRTLVEKVGDDVVSVGIDEHHTRFFVNHDNRVIEAFGPLGRHLWKAEKIGSSEFRGLDRVENRLVGEAQRTADGEWSKFSVDVATGAVRWEGEG